MAEMEIKFEKAGRIKPGQWVLIDGAVCRVTDVQVSSPGKHGSAKVRITAIGVFDGQKRQMLKPSGADVEVPIIKRKYAQVLAVMGDQVQVMDLESYETYELPIPEEEDIASKLEPGVEVEIMEAGEYRKIARVKG
ncbi:MAG: translation initiation factor [Candidatus Diapherotrites archaeon]|nr:translation initiation factor [Candidatus Diapherotrites archaeon]MDN5366903.1 translation initiation factor [Candidatus Diapherotrites archaeon]